METRKNYKWELLLLLWLSFFFNQADRQIFSVVLPLIKADLKLTDIELGLIASVLVWTYGALVPIAGFMGDRLSRKKIIGFSLSIWSVATLFTGTCSSLTQFILLRGVATGGGEAFYAPAANALISEEHAKQRSFALSIHQTAAYFGIILSGLLTGLVAEQYGWRQAFFLFGGLGLVIALIIFIRLKTDVPAKNVDKVGVIETAHIIVKKPTVLLLTGTFACMVFVNVGYLTWMPSLLVEKYHLSLASAGFSSMFYHHVGAFFGVIAGGFISDKIAKRTPRNRLVLQGIALFLGAPFIYWMGMSNNLVACYTALFLFGLFRGIYDANIFASLYEVVAPKIKSSASGLMLMSAFLIGAFSPLILGLMKPAFGLSVGLSWLSAIYLLGACLVLTAALFYFKKDQTLP